MSLRLCVLLASLAVLSCSSADVASDAGDPSDGLSFADHEVDGRRRDRGPERDSAPPAEMGPTTDAMDPDGSSQDALPLNDAGCTKSPCSLVPQCGCAAIEACDLDRTNLAAGATKCRAVTAEGFEFAQCTGMTTCAAGFVCVDRGGTQRCNKWCTHENQCNGGACVSVLYGEPIGTVPGAWTCALDCDPISNLGCPQDWACRIYSRPTGLFTDCTLPGAGPAGSDCTLDTDCAMGTYCSPVSSKCLEFCRLTPPASACSVGACTSYVSPVVVDNVEYGFCQAS